MLPQIPSFFCARTRKLPILALCILRYSISFPQSSLFYRAILYTPLRFVVCLLLSECLLFSPYNKTFSPLFISPPNRLQTNLTSTFIPVNGAFTCCKVLLAYTLLNAFNCNVNITMLSGMLNLSIS